MPETTLQKTYPVGTNEKATPIMVYTANSLVRGEVVTPENTRISTWLRTQAAPQFLRMYNAQILMFSGSGALQSLSYLEYYLHVSQVWAYHLAPPNKDQLDYDPTEPNRKMEPITVLVGTYRFNGSMRMPTQSSLNKQLDISHETFASVYDVEIMNPGIPTMGVVRVPLVLVRPNWVVFASRT